MTSTPETFIQSNLTIEATGSTPTPSVVALNVTNKNGSTAATGLKLTPSRASTTATLTIDSQSSGDIIQVGLGANQTISSVMTQRSNESVPDGLKFSNDAEFVIPNDNYRPAPETGEDNRKDYEKIESYNVRISDLFKLAQNISNYDNVLSALCRSTIYQSSNISDTNDSAWINHYASLNTPQPPLPEPLPDSP